MHFESSILHVARLLFKDYLFQVYALAAGIGPSDDLHATMLAVKATVVRDKRTHTQLL